MLFCYMKKPRRLSWFGSLWMIDINLLGVRTGANGTQHEREIRGERKSCRMSLLWIRVARGEGVEGEEGIGHRVCDKESATRNAFG